ncbi:leucine--tRNA ligase [Youngiibacter fragilis]|uniref:Leucine--tRNA ligase n=1 Tax=Youngiibacter fragilis 232.1 TaxID=994573 RepID=V7I378_9CLOT|nr:leucine--tRNA ligase [Youngiibacter fragilis]ETA79624.1 leucyl-tRNA synthetase [Youngiibacter fragilis 232.1]
MANYGKATDIKWQRTWEESGKFKFDINGKGEKLYVLEMFSYPSGSNLHAGHWFNYGPTDSWARMKRMQGYNVFQPMGFDAFGLPAENFAIKTGIHPMDSTLKNIETMEKQLRSMGAMFSWDNEVITCLPDYYRWNQFLFLKLYENDLAYRKNAPVNWCPSCMTVLANEQVVDGACERCGALVTKKDLTQWFFRITKYADELLEDLEGLDWPEKTKAMQRHWIGRSYGSTVNFKVKDTELDFSVFTTRVDTLFGATYVTLAPENDLVLKITTPGQLAEVEAYIENARSQSDIERQSLTREKTGVFTGSYAINPINGRAIPIWIGDYVLNTYGTGAVMAVPAHDERDYDFAIKYNLEIERVILGGDGLPFCEDGEMTNSGSFNGFAGDEARDKVTDYLASIGMGEKKVNYRLRDWLVSRQRYWGTPIPMVYCDKCGVVPVPEKDLPVELPYDVEFTPDGKSPLAKSEKFMNTTCPHCGGPAERDPDTLDTFVCSSWYYLRYVDNKNGNEMFSKDMVNRMLPVDKYVGGPEHAVMHLLYARFITKALRDMGYLDFNEPFQSLTHQGLILGSDGQKMSKSKGNTITPDHYIEQYGSDVFRLYLMFGFAYSEGGAWSDDGIKSIARYVDRIERNFQTSLELMESATRTETGKREKELLYWRANAIKGATEDASKMQFNTTIARTMELMNAIGKYIQDGDVNKEVLIDVLKDYTRIIAPFAPHFSEELWQLLGMDFTIFDEAWPVWDESALIKDEIEIAIQVNGKIRGRIMVPSDATEDMIKEMSLAADFTRSATDGKSIMKVIVVRGSLVNIVVK